MSVHAEWAQLLPASPAVSATPGRAEFERKSDWLSSCQQYARAGVAATLDAARTVAGARTVEVLELVFAAFPDCDPSDVFGFVNQVVDFLTAADAAAVAAVLHKHRELLRETRAEPEDRRLVMARATAISVAVRLCGVLKGSEYYAQSAVQVRYVLLASVPPSFEGVANKHRVREMPVVTKPLPVHGVGKLEEEEFEREWRAAIDLRTSLGLPPTTLTLRQFLLNVNVQRFLQDPAEHVTQLLLEDRPQQTHDPDDDEMEEGEENEDDDELARLSKSRLKQAERHLQALEKIDPFAQVLDKCRELVALLRSKVADGPGKLHLCTLWSLSGSHPLAFIEVLESASSGILVFVAQSMLVILKMQLEWPVRADDTSVLAKWAEKVNPQIVRKYKGLLRSLSDLLAPSDLAVARLLLFHELGDLAAKHEGFKPFELPVPPESDVAEESRPALEEHPRLDRLKSTGLPCLSAMASATAADNVTEYDLMSRREDELFVSSPLPAGLEEMSLAARLCVRHGDYCERMKVDEDPANEIEVDERFVTKSLNQWRVLRAPFLAGTVAHGLTQGSGLSMFLGLD